LRRSRFNQEVSPEEVRAELAEQVIRLVEPVMKPLRIDLARKPFVILIVGVNGSGKTTTIAKLAKQYGDAGHDVMLAAGDTFRAAGEAATDCVPVLLHPSSTASRFGRLLPRFLGCSLFRYAELCSLRGLVPRG
jgi:predicted ATPase